MFLKFIKIISIVAVFILLISDRRLLSQNLPIIGTEQSVLLSDREYFLSIAVLIFGTIIIIGEIFLLKIQNAIPNDILKVIITTLIVIGGLFIITSGLTTEQVAPAFGLYGAIVGYLLGKESNFVEVDKNKNRE